jgi:hypothetical protein
MTETVEGELAAEAEVFGENLPHCHFVDNKCHVQEPGIEGMTMQ